MGLASLVNNSASKVYGLARKPVEVVGSATLTLDLGDGQVVDHTFEILHDIGTTHILGRDLLRKFKSTEFDWSSHKVRLGNIWKDSRAVVEGGDLLAIAEAVCLEMSLDGDQSSLTIGDLEQHELNKLHELFSEYPSVFAENPKRPAITSFTKHRIDTGDARPIKQNIQRVSPTLTGEINRQVEDMLTNGVCRPSKSPCSRRVILVSKRDVTTRFVVDYRDLNSVTTKDAYPMSNPKDILDKMQGNQFFSFLDAASAYWCVELEEEVKHKTAFSTPRGHYEMNRMAFGLCNSQSTYQRLMDDTLRGVNNTDSYVDDICVHSSSFEEHLKDLRSEFTALQKANIQLRQDKCSFAVRSGHFVGHIISGEGRRPAPGNVE